ncbi:GPI inositol-deacylase [Pleurostoma richardsiae]|uniref:GPI inositol-deacylase n=1 Tax=Pleurostoma richardsiae TaxID=41990 RepID=A0AA38VP00_9PEZI|nr:GPI inositol-deacylase [Pleurostoma richardsiae]
MGGLVIKKAYILAKQDAAYMALADRFAAIYFLATPHRGSDSAKMLKNILRVTSERAYVGDLERNSGAIQVINDEFRHVSGKIELWSFYETQSMKLFSSPIVDPESAVLGYREEKQVPMNADHRSICKFETQLDPNYISLRDALALTVTNITTAIPRLEQRERREEIKELRKYLGVSDVFDDDLLIVREARMRNSCQWISKKDIFVEWKDGGSENGSVLWIKGKPGTGKSVLTGYIIDQLRESGHDVGFFFFRHGDESKSRLSDCLRSLAFQMASTNTEVRKAILQMRADEIRLDNVEERALWRVLFLSGIFETTTTRHFWVIDALDECSNPSFLLNSALSRRDGFSPLRVLITGRDTTDLHHGFLALPPALVQTLSVSVADTLPDLRLMIESRFQTFGVVGLEDRATLVETILDRSEGSFLWTTLLLKELKSCHSKKEIYQVLGDVPGDMKPLYKRTLDSMSQAIRGKVLAKAVLLWVACAVRPMTTGELNSALSLDIQDTFPMLEESIAVLCGQLVVVDTLGKVQMVHETAREFLLSDQLDSEFAIDRTKAHTRMAQTCLTYLIGKEMKPPRTTRRQSLANMQMKRSEFATYACTAYSYHLSRADPQAEEPLQLVEQFLKVNILSWIEVIADSGDLSGLSRASKHLNAYVNACSIERSPGDSRIRALRQWTEDLVRIPAMFSTALIKSPSAIYSLIPPFCPTGSMIHNTSSPGRRPAVLTALNEHWDDRLVCVGFSQGRPSALCYGEEFLAVGLTTGTVTLYYAASYQEYRVLNHGESVRFIAFKSKIDLIATCGTRMVKVWDVRNGVLVYSLDGPPRPLDMDFDGNVLLVASQKNFIASWDLGNGASPEPPRPWSDTPDATRSPPRRPPCALSMSVGHGILAVAYSGQPITLWDMKEDAYIGSCGKKLSSGETSTHVVVALAFNPNPSIEMLVVAYLDGDLALLDPLVNQQLKCFRASCQTLNVSPNGQFLAAGGGDGAIDVYNFSTLKLLYRVKSSNSFIKDLGFARDSLHLADIRGTQFTVWEPEVLLRDSLSDGSSGTFSASIVETAALEAKAKITAIVVHPAADVIFCGKDDGMVVLYDKKTGRFLHTVYNHKSSVRLLAWCQQRNGLLSVDAGNRIFLHKIQKAADQGPSSADVQVLFQSHLESDNAIYDILLGGDAGKLVVSTRESDHLFTLTGEHKKDRTCLGLPPIRKWVHHPRSSLHLICVDSLTVRIYLWDDWSEVESFSLALDNDTIQLKSVVLYSFMGEQRILLEFSELDGSPKTRSLAIFNANRFDISSGTGGALLNEESNPSAAVPSPGAIDDGKEVIAVPRSVAPLDSQVTTIAANVAHVIGVNDSGRLIFLDRSSWICSADLKEYGHDDGAGHGPPTVEFSRHCFVPYDWFAGGRDIVCALGQQDILFTRRGDLAIVRGYFDHSERAFSE